MDYLDMQIEESLFRLQRQKIGIEKKIALWQDIKKRLPPSFPPIDLSVNKKSTLKIEQLTFFGT